MQTFASDIAIIYSKISKLLKTTYRSITKNWLESNKIKKKI